MKSRGIGILPEVFIFAENEQEAQNKASLLHDPNIEVKYDIKFLVDKDDIIL